MSATNNNVWVSTTIGIGSNLDDPVLQVQTAISALSEISLTRLIKASSLYSNPPMGPADQPDYVNAVALLLTLLSPRGLFEEIQGIEQAQGRVRDKTERWGPRRIDLDILTYAYHVVDEPDLSIPHSGISQRNFVLLPLLEICPHLPVPGGGLVSDLAGRIDASGLRKIMP